MAKVTVIRSRWWAVLILRLLFKILCPSFFIVAVWHGMAATEGWLSPTAFTSASILLLIFSVLLIVTINWLVARVEVDATGFRVTGLLFTRAFLWREIVEIDIFSNYKLPGYHVGVRVDGSNNPRRSPLMFWNSVHHLPVGMELGGIALSKYLRRRWREAQRISQAAS